VVVLVHDEDAEIELPDGIAGPDVAAATASTVATVFAALQRLEVS
jgi:hypothetical protein